MLEWLPNANGGITAALPVPTAGQLVCVDGTGAVVTPLPGCVVPGVTVALLVEVLSIVVGVVLELFPPEPQAARRKTRQELTRKKKRQ
jgi:hypothetical protein